MQMLNGPPKSYISPRIALGRLRTREVAETEVITSPSPCVNGVIDVRPPTPLIIIREIKAITKEPIVVGPLPQLETASDVSMCSIASMSPPHTPSPPPSPTMVQVVTQEEYGYGDDVPRFDATTFAPGSRKDLVLEDVPLKIMSTEPIPLILSTTLSMIDDDLSLRDDFHPITDRSTSRESFSRSDVRPASQITHDASGFDDVHEIMPSFGSDTSIERSMSDLISDTEDFDWPIPPGPIFRFNDDGKVATAAEFAETIRQLRMQSPVLPLRIVKRNAVPLHAEIFSNLSSSESDKSEYSPPPSPSPVSDTRHTHIFNQGIPYLHDVRSRRLTSVLASLPREELITMSYLPSGTVVTFGGPMESKNILVDKLTPGDDHSDNPGEGCDSDTISDSTNWGNSSLSSSSSLDATAGSHELVPDHIAQYSRVDHDNVLPPTYKPDPMVSTDSSTPSPFDSPLPATPIPQNPDKHSCYINYTVAFLEAEYTRWKAGLLEDDSRYCFVGDDVTGGNHWSDVLLLESYT